MKYRRKKTELPLFAYRPGDSLMHKIPAGLKLLFLSVICLRIFSEKSDLLVKIFGNFGKADKIDLENIGLWQNFCDFADFMAKNQQIFCLGFYALLILASLALAKINLCHLKKLKFVLVLGVFVIYMRAVSFVPKLHFDVAGAKTGVLYTVRLFLAATGSLVVFETTSRLQIQTVFANAEKFLRKIFPPLRKIPLALAVSLAISFVPEIFAVWEQINLAVSARNPHGDKNLRIAGLKISTLFSCMLARAEETRRAVASRFSQ